MCNYTRYTCDSIMWVVPDEESLPCKVAVQILVASIQLITGLPVSAYVLQIYFVLEASVVLVLQLLHYLWTTIQTCICCEYH